MSQSVSFSYLYVLEPLVGFVDVSGQVLALFAVGYGPLAISLALGLDYYTVYSFLAAQNLEGLRLNFDPVPVQSAQGTILTSPQFFWEGSVVRDFMGTGVLFPTDANASVYP